MCMVKSGVRNLARWNWDGDVIIHESVVPSSRPVVGSCSTRKQYDIDVREFLVTADNEIMRRTLAEDITAFLKEIKGDPGLFKARGKGAFDYRANVIAAFVARKIKYHGRRGRDPWQFPDETLFLKSGDCEDRAFLIASLLLASGVSTFNVRVALGKVRHYRGQARPHDYDHAWVMYKNEAGAWILLEPLHLGSDHPTSRLSIADRLKHEDSQVEYLPLFLFNERHLWRMPQPGRQETLAAVSRKEWHRLDPKFAGAVHQSIVNQALTGVAPAWVLDALNRSFSHIFLVGPMVDDVDNPFINAYDPRDHFDNGFIAESWDRASQRLDKFAQDNTDLHSFAYAAHGIADFYAHSSYVHFANLVNAADPKGRAEVYDPPGPGQLDSAPDYSAGCTFDLTSAKFSVNPGYWKKTKAEAAAQWKGQLLSGRYAQDREIPKGLIERFTSVPEELRKQPDFWQRGSLPHHNEIAVDQAKRDAPHQLYNTNSAGSADRMAYQNQFKWRTNAACEHIRQAFQRRWKQV